MKLSFGRNKSTTVRVDSLPGGSCFTFTKGKGTVYVTTPYRPGGRVRTFVAADGTSALFYPWTQVYPREGTLKVCPVS